MTTSELIDAVAYETGYTKKETKIIIDTTLKTISETLATGDNVVAKGLGTFSTAIGAPRKLHNFHTGETLEVPPKRRVKFKVSAALKSLVAEA